MVHVRLIFVGVAVLFANPAFAEQVDRSFPIPGSPQGDLHTELFQSWVFCSAIEWQLERVEADFPELALETIAARATWKASPFAKGGDAIEEAIIEGGGEKGRDFLDEIMLDYKNAIGDLTRFDSRGEALAFLDQVNARAKGDIEVEMVRGNLLWQYKPFHDEPEKEFSSGYIQRVEHSPLRGLTLSFATPMSWKEEDTLNPQLKSFRNCYGHGNVWMTVLVQTTKDITGYQIPASDLYEANTEDVLRMNYLQLEIDLLTFKKTKLNGMPALYFTRQQLIEQLGVEAARAAAVARIYLGEFVISFQINTLGPVTGPIARDRLRKNESLFKMIASSISLTAD